MFLETFDEIDWCVNEDKKLEDGSHLYIALLEMLSGMMSQQQFFREFNRFREGLRSRQNFFKMRQHKERGLSTSFKKDPRYPLMFAHATYATIPSIYNIKFYCFITPVRHPLLTLCSMMRRSESEELCYRKWMEFLYAVKVAWKVKHSLNICMNPWSYTGFHLLAHHLNLKWNESTKKFVKDKPLVNQTLSESDRSENSPKHVWSEEINEDPRIRDAKNMLIETGGIHEILKPFIKKLEKSKVMKTYESACERISADPYNRLW